MNRLLSAFLMVIAVIGLAMPWAMGVLAERAYGSALEELTRQAGGWEAENLSWDPGYLRSESRTRLTMPGVYPALLGERFSVELVTEYRQGLTGVTATTRVAEDSVPHWDSMFPDEQPTLRTRALLNGRVHGELRVPAFEWQGGEDGEALDVSSERLRADGEWRPDGRLQFELDWDAARLSLGEATFALQEAQVRHRGKPYRKRLWVGDSLVRAESLTWDDGQRPSRQLDDARLQATANSNDGYFDARLLLSLGALTENGNDRGEQQFGFAVSEFHGDSLDRIVGALVDWSRLEEDQSVVARAGAEMTLYRELSDAFQRLSVHGGKLRVEPVVLNSEAGRLDGHLRIDYPRLPASERDRPVSLVQHGEGEAQIVLDETMLRNLPEGLQPWLGWMYREGWLVREGERYTLDVALRDRSIHYGDNVWELPPLL